MSRQAILLAFQKVAVPYYFAISSNPLLQDIWGSIDLQKDCRFHVKQGYTE